MYTPKVNLSKRKPNESDSPRTPLSFSRELRQVLQERNLLTTKTRNKVCSMLDGSFQSSPLAGNSPNPDAGKSKNFRMQAIQEIISSEQSYLAQLELLMNYFVRPLKEQAIIDAATHTILFGQIEMIHNLNNEFLRELKANVELVSPAFLKMAPFFKLYSVYAFDYRSALFLLQDLTSKNPVFRKFLERTESRPEVQCKLNSLMIVPIQRVPRYKLLLKQVLLYTSPADEDYKPLMESVKQIEATASHINSCVEDQEITQHLLHLQNSLLNRMPNIVKPSRRIIKEGVLYKITRTGSEIKRYCVLMSDIFMYCKIVKERTGHTVVENSLECCCIFPLKKCKVNELFPGNFKLTCQGDGIILGTSDLQLGRAWVGFIRDAIDLHIQCRRTLRKESSKRKPIRKKDLKTFDEDYVLSPTKRKCDYETIFRNINRSTDSEDEGQDDDSSTIGCFPRKRKVPETKICNLAATKTNLPKQAKSLKRPKAPPPPPPPPPMTSVMATAKPATSSASVTACAHNISKDNVDMRTAPQLSDTAGKENRFSKLYKLITTERVGNVRGILKRSATPNTDTLDSANSDHDPTYGFASRYSESKSYLRAHVVDNTMKHEDPLNAELGDGNFRDVLYPLRLSGGSQKSGSGGWSVPSVHGGHIAPEFSVLPPQKKRVKFDDNLDVQPPPPPQPYTFCNPKATSSAAHNPKNSLRERIYDFFANLF